MSLGKFRNKPCPCGSGKKFKKCHMFLEQGLVYNTSEKAWVRPDKRYILRAIGLNEEGNSL